MQTTLLICTLIVSLGSAAGGIITILNLLGKPIKFIQKQQTKNTENERLAIAQDVENKLEPHFNVIENQNQVQSETIAVLVTTTKDLLRKSIMNMYNEHKHERTLSETEREMLEDLYKDYRAEHGNSYIEKIYNRMSTWTITPDE